MTANCQPSISGKALGSKLDWIVPASLISSLTRWYSRVCIVLMVQGTFHINVNCLPHIDVFLDNGYTKEETKMVYETRKILEDDTIGVTATTVRVPVFYGHSESINLEAKTNISAQEVKSILNNAPGVKVVDDPENNIYPLAIDAAGQDLTLVGRIRDDESIKNGINMWVVADNIRKGAATNAVQIAEILAKEYL